MANKDKKEQPGKQEKEAKTEATAKIVKKQEEKSETKGQLSTELVIDAKNATLGRLSSYVAKQALSGKAISIVNSEKAIISGRKEDILARYLEKRARGTPEHGPFFPKEPEKILKRSIRGMLSYKKPRARAAFKKIKCYAGMPEKYIRSNKISSGKEKTGRFITLEQLSKLLKGQKEK